MLADRTVRLAAATLASLALVACGETTRTKPTAHATPRVPADVKPTVFPAPTSAAATPSETASSAPTASATSAAPPAGGNAVKAAGTKFTPDKLQVKVGAKIIWTSASGEFHSVTSGTPGAKAPGPLNAPVGFTTYTFTFTKAGTYQYFCEPHGTLGMVGQIVVS